jgi:hypothetical protein
MRRNTLDYELWNKHLISSVAGKYRSAALLAFVACLALIATSITAIQAVGAQEDLIVTVADAGIDEYNLEDTGTVGVETFDNRPTTINSSFAFTGDAGDFSGCCYIVDSAVIGGSNSNGGTEGKFASTGQGGEILFTMPSSSDYKYVGFWWSAGNAANYVELLDEEQNSLAIFQVDLPESNEDLYGLVGDCGEPRSAYCGNQNYSPIEYETEPFAFVHLRYEPGFRFVRFSGAGFEFDNVTVSQTVPVFATTENTVETFNPYTISTAEVLLADPRATSVRFPGMSLAEGADESNAMICFTQVAQGGGVLSGPPSIVASGSGTGIAVATDTNLVAFSGARGAVENLSSNVLLEAVAEGQQFGVSSVYLRVSVTPQTNFGTAACSGSNSDSSVIEVRFLNILQSNSVSVSID